MKGIYKQQQHPGPRANSLKMQQQQELKALEDGNNTPLQVTYYFTAKANIPAPACIWNGLKHDNIITYNCKVVT